MKELEIVYYIDMKTEQIQPFVKEKGASNADKFVLDTLNGMFCSSRLPEEENKENRLTFLTGYYIDLMKKGHSFEQMDCLLRDAFYNAKSHAFLEPLMEQREALMEAKTTYHEDKTTFGLQDIYNMLVVQEHLNQKHVRSLSPRNYR